jgi:enterochelin esterase family protein
MSIQAFDNLRAQLAASPGEQHQALVDAFVMQHPRSPLVGDDEAIIYYTGAAHQVLLRGDMLGEETVALEQLSGTDVWFHRGRYESDARLDYHLLVDGEDVGDPRNPHRVPSGYGPRAEIRMPEYHDLELWRERPRVAHGTLHEHAGFRSTVYPSTRTMWVYTPPGYDPACRYPTVYFHDGGDYLRFGNAATIFDNLLADGKIPPCIAVFVDPSTEHGRLIDYDLNLGYVRLICDELVRFIDAHYSTQREPECRAIVGASFGGLISLLIAHQCPDLFGVVASQSGFVSRAGDALIERYTHAPQLLHVHLIIGTYETHIGTSDRGSGEANFLRGNRALRDVLHANGYHCAYIEYHEGHSWGLWRARLGDALVWMLANNTEVS